MGFTVVEGRIIAIDAIADPERVRRIAASDRPTTDSTSNQPRTLGADRDTSTGAAK
jgi:hypothetical protein